MVDLERKKENRMKKDQTKRKIRKTKIKAINKKNCHIKRKQMPEIELTPFYTCQSSFLAELICRLNPHNLANLNLRDISLQEKDSNLENLHRLLHK